MILYIFSPLMKSDILKKKYENFAVWVLRTSSAKHVVFKWKDSNSNTNNFLFEICEQNFKLLIFLHEIKEKYVNTLQHKKKRREKKGVHIFTRILYSLQNYVN